MPIIDRRVTSRANMFNAVKKVCDGRPEAVALFPSFAALVVTLGVFITELKAMMQKLSRNQEGTGERKKQLRSDLALRLAALCGAGISLGRKLANQEVEKAFGFVESDFLHLKDSELVEVASDLLSLQQVHDKDLLDYGITPELVSEIASLRTEFETISPEPIVNVYTGEADRKELLAKAFQVSDFVLNDLMSAAKIFKLKDPNFFLTLENASRISKVGVRHEAPTDGQVTRTATTKQATAERKAKLEEQRAQERKELEALMESMSEAGKVETVEFSKNGNGTLLPANG